MPGVMNDWALKDVTFSIRTLLLVCGQCLRVEMKGIGNLKSYRSVRVVIMKSSSFLHHPSLLV